MTRPLAVNIPPACCKPNARPHWAAKARAVKGYRADVAAMCLSWTHGRRPRFKALTVQAKFYFASPRRRDADNLLAWLKPTFDGLADAGLIENDAGLTHKPVLQEFDKLNPRVELTFWTTED